VVGEILVFAGRVVGLELVEFLLQGGYPVARVIAGSRDDTPILQSAAHHGIPAEVYGPSTQQGLVERGDRYRWLLNLWSSHVLKPHALALADKRLNIHPSLVPNCRGNDNAAWTIRRGVPAGISLLEMDATLDTGGIYVQREVAYEFPIRGSELHSKLLSAASALFKDEWPAIYSADVRPCRQGAAGSYHTRKQTDSDRMINWSDTVSVEELVSRALAHDFYPGTTAELIRDGICYRLRLSIENIEK
jgi:methionyl-tRNA formyltransferase